MEWTGVILCQIGCITYGRYRAEVNAVIRIGLSLSNEPLITASCNVKPLDINSLYLSISSIPFLVAMPKREMNPIIAGMLMMPSVKKTANTPPINANGRLSNTASAWLPLPMVKRC